MKKTIKHERNIEVFKYLPSIKNSNFYTFYRRILVVFDEDLDCRVLDFINQLPDDIRKQLLCVSEAEGSLGLLWENDIPKGYNVNNGIQLEFDTDCWSIVESNVLNTLGQPNGTKSL